MGRVRAGFGALLALMALCVMAPGAQADTVKASASAEMVVKRGHRGSAVRQIQSKLGIPADEVFGPQTERAVRLPALKGLLADGIVGPQTRGRWLEPLSSNSVGRRSGVGSEGAGHPPRDRRMRVRRQPARVSPDGQYRGKYQFSQGTWEGLGGTGDPPRRAEWKQDRLALKLYRRSETRPGRAAPDQPFG